LPEVRQPVAEDNLEPCTALNHDTPDFRPVEDSGGYARSATITEAEATLTAAHPRGSGGAGNPGLRRSPSAVGAWILAGMWNRFALVAVAILVTACAVSPAELAGTPAPSLPMIATATATPSPTPQPTERPIGADEVVATTVENLRVRTAPGTDSKALGVLDLGTIAFVMDAPVVEGVAWYPVSGLGVPPFSGCPVVPGSAPVNACPAWRGWVAGASPDGDPWLERAPPPDECPEPSLAAIMRIPLTYRLICFGDDPLTFTAYWPELPPNAGLGGYCPAQDLDLAWLLCQHTNYSVVTARETDDIFDGLRITINPSSDVAYPPRGQWLRITGHFDDPAAQRCGEVASEPYSSIDAIGAVFQCRLEFVATAISPTSAP
jgi:hypothetical protein